jgi:hypothetical protein
MNGHIVHRLPAGRERFTKPQPLINTASLGWGEAPLVGGGKTAAAEAGISTGLRYGTGTAPANGSAMTGTGFGDGQFFGSPSTAFNGQFALNGIISGLTPGTPVWVDVAFDTANSSDAASLVNLSAIIEEVS